MSNAQARSTTLTSQITVGIKRQVVDRTAQVIYATFPKMSVAQEASRKYFAIFASSVTVLGLLALLGVHTLLAQDAFTLSNLKIEAKMVADQREALNRLIDSHSAPDALARAATKLGMTPSESAVFLNLTPEELARG
jgi:hypothetical protein